MATPQRIPGQRIGNSPVPAESLNNVPGLSPLDPDTDQAEMPIDLDTFLRMAIAQGVSDIHLRTGFPPVLRKDGDMIQTKLAPLAEQSINLFAKKIIPPRVLPLLKNRLDFDFGFEFEGAARFRVNLFYEMGRLGLVMRLISLKIPTLDDLGHPASIRRFADLNQGLVLVTGPTGSGKSTTLAALLNTINTSRQMHIVTLEDPVEYVYKSEKSVVTQRQLGLDTDSFPNGIKYALRQDPDVLLIGEMRDRETMMAALHAAETGHLVFSTLHTTDAVQTINRIINAFEPFEREPIRHQLAAILQGTVAQRLVKRAEGSGRLAVAEIMTVTPAIRDYIMREQMDEIYQLLKAGEFEGACDLNHALYRAVKNGFITAEDAIDTSDNRTELQQMLRGAYHGSSGQ
ncbi:MAG: PilT/PilU family type 4a pilus ATPase [Vampirovibrionales bacterium]|nr:PilT/PilU family type 4a pilus ATPase [Vampirovibrionales bacterium]